MGKMLERLQSALKTVKETKPGSLMTHRFVTVRRGSPAARSGHIEPGDRLEAVEGRPVGALQHRDLAQILRRAGNTLRLTIAPRHNTVTEGADLDIDGRVIRSSRSRAKEDVRFYSVDLERGPTGFGFSLRGGSEYNMGLYVLGLMQGGPAQRSNKIQVSDQLVEINGDNTAGMTHSQAVDQIRRGGHHIHLVLKRGNGYVPDYGPEEGVLSSSPPQSSPSPRPLADAPVTTVTAPAPVTTANTSSIITARPVTGNTAGGGEGERSNKSDRNRAIKHRPTAPDLDLDEVDEELRQKQRRKSPNVHLKNQDEQGRGSRSLPRNRASSWDRAVTEEGVTEKKRKSKRKEADILREDPKMTASILRDGPKMAAVSEPFSFLMARNDSTPSDSESVASFSEVSQSAASVAWREEESDWRDSNSPPGPHWLKPSPQKLTKVLIGSRLSGQGLVGGLSL